MIKTLYRSFAEASASISDGGYDSELLATVVARKTSTFRENARLTRRLEIGAARTGLFLASMDATAGSNLRIFDVGGACGYHYVIAKLLRPHVNFEWSVIETPAMVNAAKGIWSEGNLEFCESWGRSRLSSRPPDAVLISSTLQYLPEPYQTLAQIFRRNPKHVFITRTPFSSYDEGVLVGIQRSRLSENGPGPLPQGFADAEICYPISYLSYAAVTQLAIDNGYEYSYSLVEEKPNLRVNGRELDTQYTLLFTRLDSRMSL